MKLFRTFLLFSFSFSLFVNAFAYSDLQMQSFVYPSIKYLTEKSFVKGYTDGRFGVDDPINRVEALKLILTATEGDLESSDVSFIDVPTDAWFAPFVLHARKKGIVKGDVTTNQFFPNRQVSRAEFIKMLLLSFDVPVDLYDLTSLTLSDVSEEAWYAKYMKFAVKFGIIKPNQANQVSPETLITRGESAYLLFRSLEKGRGLDPQILLNLVERHLLYSLDVLQNGELTEASLAVDVSQKYVDILKNGGVETPIVKTAELTTQALKNLVGAYISAQNGLPDDVILAAKKTWGIAEEGQNMNPNEVNVLFEEIKKLAGTVANTARTIKTELEKEVENR